jgi:hypothetical protein
MLCDNRLLLIFVHPVDSVGSDVLHGTRRENYEAYFRETNERRM